MVSKIIYVGREPQATSFGGSVVAERNLKSLYQIFGKENVYVFRTPKTTTRNVLGSMFRLGSYGVPLSIEKNICKFQKEHDVKLAFIEGTLANSLIRKLTRQGCTTVAFAHNVEQKLYLHRLRQKRSLLSLIRYAYVRLNEKSVIHTTSKLIVLNDRDSKFMQKIYNRLPDAILPITFQSNLNYSVNTCEVKSHKPYVLFVGSDFFPNIEGLRWFIQKVSPYLNKYNTYVVGGCCKNIGISSLPLPDNVKLLGYIDNLDICYHNASAVVAPIFSGSGMKTKTVEAMSYGKTIFGTTEAFSGIEADFNSIGGLCDDAETFIKCINEYNGSYINDYTVKYFNENFTHEIFIEKLKKVL